MSIAVAEQDFNNFDLENIGLDRQNVYELGRGVLSRAANLVGVELSADPNARELTRLSNQIGRNLPAGDSGRMVAIERSTGLELVEKSGIQRTFERSLWTPEIGADHIDIAVMAGAPVYLQEGTLSIIQDKVRPEVPVVVVAGSRPMDSPDEQAHPIIAKFFEAHGQYPTESDYARDSIIPRLRVSHGTVLDMTGYETGNRDKIPQELFDDMPQLLDKKIGFTGIANNALQLALMMRSAAIERRFDFDDRHDDPQVYILSEGFPLAGTAVEEKQPATHQKPIAVLKQLAITAKLLHEAAISEEFAD